MSKMSQLHAEAVRLGVDTASTTAIEQTLQAQAEEEAS